MSALHTIDRAAWLLRLAAATMLLLTATTVLLATTTNLGARSLIAELFALDVLWLTGVGLTIYFARTREAGRTVAQSWRLVAERVVPPPVRRMLGSELALLRGLLRAVSGRGPVVPVGAIPVRPPSGVNAVVLAMLVVVAIEATVIELVVPWPVARAVVHVFEAYAVLFLLGMLVLPRQYPHCVTSHELVLRSGHTVVASIPLGSINSVVKRMDASTTDPQLRGSLLLLPHLGECGWAVQLDRPVVARIPALRRDQVGEVTEIRLAGDALDALLSAKRLG